MPTAYILAKDNLEQARAILSNEVWRDDRIEYLLDLAIARLLELDRRIWSDERGEQTFDMSFRPS